MSSYDFPRVGRIPSVTRKTSNVANVWTKPAPGSASAAPKTSPSLAASAAASEGSSSNGSSHHRAPSLKSVRIHSAAPSTSAVLHPLKHDYIMSCGYRAGNQRLSEADWEQSMKRLASFGSVESFWTVWTHLKRPSQLPPITDIYIFKLGIAPKWEDPSNVNGGKFVLRLKKGLADRIFESLVLAMIGQQLEPGPAAASDSEGETSSSPARPSLPTATLEDAEEICGCVLSVRSNEDMISIWNRSRSSERREALRKTIQARIAELKLPINEKTGLTYKPHHDHLKNHNNNNHNSQNSPSSRNSHHHHNNSHRDHQHHNGHASKRMQRYDYPVRATDTVDEALEAELRDSQS